MSPDPFPAHGPNDVKRIVTMLRTMLPDFHIEVEAIIAEGDIVVSRVTRRRRPIPTATWKAGDREDDPDDPAMQMFRVGMPRAGLRFATDLPRYDSSEDPPTS